VDERNRSQKKTRTVYREDEGEEQFFHMIQHHMETAQISEAKLSTTSTRQQLEEDCRPDHRAEQSRAEQSRGALKCERCHRWREKTSFQKGNAQINVSLVASFLCPLMDFASIVEKEREKEMKWQNPRDYIDNQGIKPRFLHVLSHLKTFQKNSACESLSVNTFDMIVYPQKEFFWKFLR
jgi:hypothetical protein